MSTDRPASIFAVSSGHPSLSAPPPYPPTVPDFTDLATTLLVLDQLCYALKLLPPYPGSQPDES